MEDLQKQLSSLLGGLFLSAHIIPYAIILANCFIFKLLRSLGNRIFAYYLISNKQDSFSNVKLVKLFIDELISTCELCADCAELNVVYEKHGSLAYGVSLLILTCLWMDTFGDAHTTPGYLAEEYFLIKGSSLLRQADTYARFVGQSLAMPLAWRFASLYWRYHLIEEHRAMLITENCHSSLATSTLNGFLIELICCLICRLIELVGHKLLERQSFSQRAVSLFSSFMQSLLVVMALELSGGYFNPVLAASLEYGCKGIQFWQHALVFWFGPLIGHVSARGIFRRFVTELTEEQIISSAQKTTSSQRQRRKRSIPKTPTSPQSSPTTRSVIHRKKSAID